MLTEPWQFSMLGRFQVRQAESTVERFRTRKTASLLAYLAYTGGQAHAREALAVQFWPDSPPELALKSLGVSLSSLRHLLEPPGVASGSILLADRRQIGMFPEAFQTDVAHFTHALQQAARASEREVRCLSLAAAIQHYGGDLLPGFYDEWIFPEREQCAQQYQNALTELIGLLQAMQEPAKAIPYALRLTQHNPYDEDACAVLMELCTATDQNELALRHYNALEGHLRTELNAEPDEKLRQQASALRANVVTQRLPPSPIPKTAFSSASPNNTHTVKLPITLTRFFGRQSDVEQLLTFLNRSACRLVTLTGPGGTGKTRLAIETARRFAENYHGRILFVPLADLTAPSQVIGAIRNALQLPEPKTESPETQIVTALTPIPTLLLLDNLEHLLSFPLDTLDAALIPDLFMELLALAPTLTLLTTSRQPIGLEGEQEFPVSPLPTPQKIGSPERLLEFASVQLFVDRARLKQPDFQITPRNAEEVIALCNRLEGIPLALELAASWIRAYPPAAMLDYLQQGVTSLSTRQKGVPERHRTLQEVIAWSYRLLDIDLQRFFAQLSVFQGGWTADAAQTVCQELSAYEYLARLQETSLILAENREGATRFRMLETVREFAGKMLTEADRHLLLKQHAEYMKTLLLQVYESPLTPELTLRTQRLSAEEDNILMAINWSLNEEGEADTALWLTALTVYTSFVNNPADRRRLHLEQALSQGPSEPSIARARALLSLASLLDWQQVEAQPARLYEESLIMSRALQDNTGIARSLIGLALCQEELSYANTLLHQALEICQKIGDQGGETHALSNLAEGYRRQGNYTESLSLRQQTLRIYREAGYAGSRFVYEQIAIGELFRQSDLGDPVPTFAEALTQAQQLHHGGMASWAMSHLGQISYYRGRYTEAQAYLNEARSLCRTDSDILGIYHDSAFLVKIALCLDQRETARACLEEAFQVAHDTLQPSLYAAEQAAAYWAVLQHQPTLAVRFFARAETVRQKYAHTIYPAAYQDESKEQADLLARCRVLLEPEAYQRAWQEGEQMSQQDAIRAAQTELWKP